VRVAALWYRPKDKSGLAGQEAKGENMPANIADLQKLFYGGGTDAEYAALQAFADAGLTANDLLGTTTEGVAAHVAETTSVHGIADTAQVAKKNAANTFTANQTLSGTNKLLAGGGIGVGNSAAATTPGEVVKRIEVFDAAGVSLGFVAVYDEIT